MKKISFLSLALLTSSFGILWLGNISPAQAESWKLTQNSLPSNAVTGGRVSDSPYPMYICRANHNGNLHPGKLAFYNNRWSCFIGNGGVEQRYETYEVLTYN